MDRLYGVPQCRNASTLELGSLAGRELSSPSYGTPSRREQGSWELLAKVALPPPANSPRPLDIPGSSEHAQQPAKRLFRSNSKSNVPYAVRASGRGCTVSGG